MFLGIMKLPPGSMLQLIRANFFHFLMFFLFPCPLECSVIARLLIIFSQSRPVSSS